MTKEDNKISGSKMNETEKREETTESLEPETTAKERVRTIPINKLDIKRLIELDACTRCGECLSWCPVYDQDSKEALIPRRKIIDFLRLARSQRGFLAGIMKSDNIGESLKKIIEKICGYKEVTKEQVDEFVSNLYECSTCGQCEVVCPARIDTVNLWEELRRLIVRADYGPLEPQKALRKSVKTFDNPWQQPRAGRTKWSRRAKKDKLIKSEPRQIKKTKGKVLLFFGCTASYDVNVKKVAINTINILEALDIDYGVLGKDEKCCGSVLLRMGDPEYERLFKENIEQFNNLGIDTLISSCSGCFKTIMQDYPKVEKLNFEVLHTVEYLARLLKFGDLKFSHPVNKTVTYHDPCHLGRATGGFDAPRMIMDAIPGLNLIEMPRNNERIGILDLIVLGTEPSTDNLDYGGGDLFKDLVSGKQVQVKIETPGGQHLSSATTLKEIPHAMLHASRNAFKNYLAFVNPGKAAISTIFHSDMMKGNYEEMTFCGCGELNPLENDPELKTIGIGTKVQINGAQGFVTGAGTRSSADKPNLTGFADMHKMNPDLMGGFKTGHGPDVITTWAVPIPILDENILTHILKLDEEIPLKVVDVRNRKPIFEITYGDVWGSADHKIRFNEKKCQQCDDFCHVHNICPVKAIHSEPDKCLTFDQSKCFNCGLCVSICSGGAFSANMGSVEFKEVNIPIALRQSNRVSAIKAAQELKKQIQNSAFKITEPVEKINFPGKS